MLGLDGVAGITFNDASAQGTSALSGTRVPTAKMPAGSVLQVVQQVATNGFTTTTTNSWVATGFTASITPTSVNSKILVRTGGFNVNQSSAVTFGVGLYRGSTQIPSSSTWFSGLNYSSSGELQGLSIEYLDSPATTSSTTYQLYLYMTSGGTASINGSMTGIGSGVGTITLMEIAQ